MAFVPIPPSRPTPIYSAPMLLEELTTPVQHDPRWLQTAGDHLDGSVSDANSGTDERPFDASFGEARSPPDSAQVVHPGGGDSQLDPDLSSQIGLSSSPSSPPPPPSFTLTLSPSSSSSSSLGASLRRRPLPEPPTWVSNERDGLDVFVASEVRPKHLQPLVYLLERRHLLCPAVVNRCETRRQTWPPRHSTHNGLPHRMWPTGALSPPLPPPPDSLALARPRTPSRTPRTTRTTRPMHRLCSRSTPGTFTRPSQPFHASPYRLG